MTNFRIEPIDDATVRVHTDAPGERATSAVIAREDLAEALRDLGYTVTAADAPAATAATPEQGDA